MLVSAQTHPFRHDLTQFDAPVGTPLHNVFAELLHRSGSDPIMLRYAAVMMGDNLIPKSEWAVAVVTGPVAIKALPGGDFLGILTTLVGIGLNFIVPGSGFAIMGFQFSQFAIRMGITLATTLIAQALAPTPRQTLSNQREAPPEARYTITGVQNQALPYGTIPCIYGRLVNYHPPLAAIPYIETYGGMGDLQFIRMLFCVGLGEVTISDLKIGDSSLYTFRNMNWETRAGLSTDTDPALFPNQVREQTLSIELRYANGYSYRTTEPDTDQIILDVQFPSGMGRVTDRNEKLGIYVQFHVVYRALNVGSFNSAPLSEGGGLILNGNGYFQFAAYQKSALRRAVSFRVTRGQYEVGIRRVTVDDQSDVSGDNQSTTFEQSYWTSMRSVQFQQPINRNGLALISVFGQASEQLNGVIDQLNCTVQRKLPVWNGSTWTTQATRNPAWAFCDVLTNATANARPLDTSRLDLPTILAWAQACDNAGITFDGVLTSRSSVWDTLSDICATGFATPAIRDGLFSVAHDTVRSTVVQHFTPRNLKGFKASKMYGTLPHAITVRYPNELTLHQTDELIVYDDGYTAANATVFETVDLPFTTSKTQAWKAGRRHLASARLRPELYTAEVDLEWLVCQRGDLVRVAHDVVLIGVGWARVRTVTLDGSGNCTDITTDASLPMSGASTYALRMRLATGTVLHAVDTVAGYQTAFTFTTPIPVGDPQPLTGDLVILGETDSETAEMVVRSIEPHDDLSATLTLVDYAPAIFTADSGIIPDFDPKITLPPVVNRNAPPRPVILSVVSDERALVGRYPTVRVLFECVPLQTQTKPEIVQLRWRRFGETVDYLLQTVQPGGGIIVIQPVDEGEVLEIGLRSVSTFGLTSEWNTVTHTVVGRTNPPPDIEQAYRQRNLLTWPYDPPLDFAGFRLRAHYGTVQTWDNARPLHQGLVLDALFDISELDGTQTVLIKAVDTLGIESANPAIVTLNLGDVLVDNIILTQSEDPAFTGTIDGASVVANELVLTSTTLFWFSDTVTFWDTTASNDFWPASVYVDGSYIARYAPVTDEIGALVKLDLTIVGNYAVDYRSSSSVDFWASGPSTFWSATGTDDFWGADVLGPWMPWPGVLGPITSTADSYDIRISMEGGYTEGKITQFDILIDAPDITESFEDTAISSGGTRLTPTLTYRVIKNVQITVQDDGGTGITARILDKNATTGPNIKVLDAAGTAVNGTIDAIIQGY